MLADLPLSYRLTPSGLNRRARRKCYCGLFAATLPVLGFVLLFLCVYIPLLDETCARIQAHPPLWTEWAMRISHFCKLGGWLFGLPIAVWLPFVPAWRIARAESLRGGVFIALGYLALLFSGVMLFVSSMSVAIILPLYRIRESMGML